MADSTSRGTSSLALTLTSSSCLETSSSAQESEDEIILVEKKNTTANVWKYFGLKKDATIKTPICRLCLHEVSASHGNTTNLLSHLKHNHPKEYNEVKPSKKAKEGDSSQLSIHSSLARSTMISTTSTEHKKLTRAVARCIAKDMLPLNIVDKPGFRGMVGMLNPRYQLPHKDHFSRYTIPALYAEVHDQVHEDLQKEMKFFSATTDMWSSCTIDPYLSFTIHYISSSWELISYCLQVHFMPEQHTGENLELALTSTLQEWDLDEKQLVSITTDNGSNIKLACTLLGWSRVSCFGHNLDLAIRKSLDDQRVDRVVRLCRKIVATFSSSWKRTKALQEALQQQGLPVRKLRADVATRWGSTIFMLKRIKEQIDAIRITLSNDRKVSNLVPTWQDSDVIEAVIAALDPLEDLTDLLSGEKRVTSSVIKPLLHKLMTNILIGKEDETTLTRQMKSVIRQDLENRYCDTAMSDFLDICSLLDPRFKGIFTMDSEAVKTVTDVLIPSTVLEMETPKDTEVEQPASKKGKFAKIFGASYVSTVSEKETQAPGREMLLYLQLPVLDIDGDPLAWWKHECTRLPLLSHLARKYLCSCATSVASERTFSTAGNIITNARSLLKPEKANQLIFLAKNMK